MSERQLKINFYIPFINKTGGIITILEHYFELKKLGHDVEIFYPIIPYYNFFSDSVPFYSRIFYILRYFIKKLFIPVNKISWHFHQIPVKPVLLFRNVFIRNADISIATAWLTAKDVYRLSSKKGIKFYFVQGYETWSGKINLVENTYRLPFNVITISPWLTSVLQKNYNANIVGEIHNGIRLEKFSAITKPDEITILMICSDLELKGTHEGLIALGKIKNEFPQVKILLFGTCVKPEFDFEAQYYQNPSNEQIVSFYQRATIFLFPSHADGWGLPVAEAMACKCAVVTTRVGCVPVFYNGHNLLIVRPKAPYSICRGLRLLVLDKNRRSQIAEKGYHTIKNFSWEKSSKKLESLFLKSLL